MMFVVLALKKNDPKLIVKIIRLILYNLMFKYFNTLDNRHPIITKLGQALVCLSPPHTLS